ncbi:GNAT family N-acetyltransferase [Streptomyces sp. NPDC001889]
MTAIERHGDPGSAAGWDRLAATRSFYLTANWLRFVDADGGAEPHYLSSRRGDGLSAGLVAHWNPDEGHQDYRAPRVLGQPRDAGPMLLLGGRRGFRSDVLLPGVPQGRSAVPGPGRATEELAALLGAAAGAVPEAGGRWWWPNLPTDAATEVIAAARTLTPGIAPGLHLLRADCTVETVGAGLDDFVGALSPKQRRTNARREIRRFAESGLEVRRMSLSDIWERGAPLLGQVQRKYGHDMSDERLRGFLGRQAEHLDREAVVFAVHDGGRLIGFSLCYEAGDELALRLIGFDYPRLPGADEYAQLLLYAPLRYCYERGLTRLHLGTSSYDAKCRRGARVRPLWAVTSGGSAPPGPDGGPSDRIGRQLAALTAGLPAREAAALAAEVHTSLAAWSTLPESKERP